LPTLLNSFEAYMNHGTKEQKIGRLDDSITTFIHALGVAESDDQRAQAWQMRGISQRLNKYFLEAHKSFEEARIAAGTDNVRIAHIDRDDAMVLIDEFEKTGTHEKLNRAIAMLKHSMSVFNYVGEQVEAAMSRGFLGYALSFYTDQTRALKELKAADAVLRDGDNRDYELSNLTRLMEIESFLGKLWHMPRFLRLIRVTGQTRRYKQAIRRRLFGK
jgi:tetratricopeptide (TPR) repeat protein